jgi:hypothetical protein
MQIEGITPSITGANRPTRAKLMAGKARDWAQKSPGTPITTGLLIPNVCITAAMLVAFLPGRPWQGHLELIWKLETDDGVNCSALRFAARRFRRTSVTSTPEADS